MSTLSLPDGRLLDVEVSGPADGVPLVYHHGTPGGRPQMHYLQRATAARGLRLVTFSRAGYGMSTRRPGRSVADAAEDTRALLDSIGAERCLVAGWSGGGPHALACGALLPDRVAGVLVMAGVAPYGAAGLDFLAGMGEQNVEEFGLALQGEDAVRPYVQVLGEGLAQIDAAGIVDELSTLLPPIDVEVITEEFGDDLAVSFREAVRNGVDGIVDDDLAFCAPWGFDLAAIDLPTFVWQGSEDLMVPFAHGQWLASALPGAVAHLEQGEGHLSIVVGAVDRMLDELVAVL